MGWDGIVGGTRVQLIAEICSGWENHTEGTGCKVIRVKRMRDCVWAVREVTAADGEVYRVITLDLVEKHGGEWMRKSMDESMGPIAKGCPVGFIACADRKPKAGGLGSYSETFRTRVETENVQG